MNIRSTVEKTGVGFNSTFSEAPQIATQSLGKLNGLLIFALALGLRIWFNFLFPHLNTSRACDAWEYLTNAGALLHLKDMPASFWTSFFGCLAGTASTAARQTVLSEIQPLTVLSISGPTFPSFLALSYLAIGAKFDASNWMIPVAAQALVSSLTCLLAAMLASNVWNRKVGILTGILVALYPGFIINSGRLITETLAAFLTTLSMWLTARLVTLKGKSLSELFLLAASCGILQLTRPVLLLLSPCLIPAVLVQPTSRRKLLAVAVSALGLALMLGPWVAWQTVATGHPSLVVDRLGTYNFYIGNDPFTGGWLAAPLQTVDAIRNKGLGQLAAEFILASPVDFTRHTVEKLARLFELPLNDFRASLGPFAPGAQALFHQFLIAFSAVGIVLSLFLGSTTESPGTRQIWCRLLMLWTIAIHFAYLLFNALARYALPAMPFVIAFSAAGIMSLAELSRKSTYRRRCLLLAAAAISLVFVLRANFVPELATALGPTKIAECLILNCSLKVVSLLLLLFSLWQCANCLQGNRQLARCISLLITLLVIPSACLQIRAHGRWQEWQQTLERPGDKVAETIQLSAELCNVLTDRQCYLLIDADGWQKFFKTAKVIVNGQTIKGPIIPGISLPDCIFWYTDEPDGNVTRNYERIFGALALGTGVTIPDLRQWFLIPLPQAISKQQTLKVEIEQCGNAPIKLFGTYPAKKNTLQIPNVYNYSWEKAFYGVENDDGLSDTRIDASIGRATCPPHYTDLSSAHGLQCGNFNIRLLASPRSESSKNQLLKPIFCYQAADDITVSGLQSHHLTIKNLPKEESGLPWQTPEQLWLVRLSGQAKCNSSSSQATAAVTLQSHDQAGKTHRYNSPWIPVIKDDSQQWIPFDFAFPVNPRSFPGTITSIDFHCHAVEPAAAAISPPLAGNTSAQFTNLRLEIFAMPVLPTARGYEVY
jgi:4-amino-4-deoxy-L-arabinose transferase-like glycosyltransferase